MPRKCENLIDRKFGRLTVIARAPDHIGKDGRKEIMWECLCDCGNPNPVVVMGSNLKRKNRGTQSCGCLARELSSERAKETVKELHKKNHKVNTYDLSGEYAIGYTSKGEEFWFDKEDYNLVKDYCWHYTQKGYLEATNAETRKAIKLHRLVMGVTNLKVQVDHKKHPTIYEHKIDNRKSNLEIVNQSQNSMNRSLAKNNTSGIVGVS